MACVGLAFDILGFWDSGFAFLLLFLLSVVTYGFGFFTKRMRLQRRGKLIAASIIIGMLLLFFAPAVQTLPSGGSSGSYCDPACSSINQFQSVTEYFWCMGAQYQYSLPPSVEFYFTVGCPVIPTF